MTFNVTSHFVLLSVISEVGTTFMIFVIHFKKKKRGGVMKY